MILYPSKIFYSTKNSNYSIVFRHNKILFIIALKRLWTIKCYFFQAMFSDRKKRKGMVGQQSNLSSFTTAFVKLAILR